ncbi:MAG: tRNA (adenosine(37)-N6)-threonylcarbamoyltransferase complex ATPase subunit type 1 TsaE [Thermovirgaceae bacterium]
MTGNNKKPAPLVFSIESKTEKNTYDLGREAACFAFPGLCILLSGELGSGKTVFARGFAAHFDVTSVRSPSFTLVNEYEGNMPIAHADLYRLCETDGYDIGLFDYQQAGFITIVEWGERWKHPPGNDLWQIDFQRRNGDSVTMDGERGDMTFLLSFRCLGKQACDRLAQCREHLRTEWSIL